MELPDSSPRAVMTGHPGKRVLAIDPALGTVFICNGCARVHLQVGDLHLGTDVAGFHSLVVLLTRAAANFELWAEHQGSAA
ncbi:MAG: hypothetical protein IT162_19440 [Bryobacterales bacterium]|nr:hypothetical protein [Bryobacterales bacterium]